MNTNLHYTQEVNTDFFQVKDLTKHQSPIYKKNLSEMLRLCFIFGHKNPGKYVSRRYLR